MFFFVFMTKFLKIRAKFKNFFCKKAITLLAKFVFNYKREEGSELVKVKSKVMRI